MAFSYLLDSSSLWTLQLGWKPPPQCSMRLLLVSWMNALPNSGPETECGLLLESKLSFFTCVLTNFLVCIADG